MVRPTPRHKGVTGTLIVVSHDRYLLERVTDQQYAVIDGGLRHLPGGIDEYLELRTGQATALETEVMQLEDHWLQLQEKLG